jgi:hypothetical protein
MHPQMSPTIHDIPIKHNTHAIVTEKTLENVQKQLSMTSDKLDVIRTSSGPLCLTQNRLLKPENRHTKSSSMTRDVRNAYTIINAEQTTPKISYISRRQPASKSWLNMYRLISTLMTPSSELKAHSVRFIGDRPAPKRGCSCSCRRSVHGIGWDLQMEDSSIVYSSSQIENSWIVYFSNQIENKRILHSLSHPGIKTSKQGRSLTDY